MRLSRRWVMMFGVAGLAILAYTQLTLFVIQPIGAVPDGRTIILWRHSAALNFVDSADGFCARQQGGVSLLCRAVVLGTVIKINPILVRLPYSHVLYLLSTGGADYNK